MTDSFLPLTAEARAALTGFLRGIERRAAVVAELACGSPRHGDAAVQAATHAFCRAAARAPLADWDASFWGLLLAAPQWRRAPDGDWPEPWTRLGALGPGLRVAVLLRLVAGLDDGQVADLLGIAPATQALALQRALGERGAPSQSPRWQAWLLASRQQLRQLGGERLVGLAQAREAALDGRPPRARREHARWQVPLLWTGLATCVLAFAATFLLPDPGRDATPEIRVGTLPPADPPLARFDDETALLTHRDFDQLAASPAQQALARELAFYAWYAAQSPNGAEQSDAPGSTTGARTHASD
jgi:hypothetical protein